MPLKLPRFPVWATAVSLPVVVASLVHTFGSARAESGLTRAIVNGAASPGDHAIVALLTDERRLGCTGTLIRPHVVLTGAHCIDLANELPADVFIGADLAKPSTAVPVVKRLVHPEFSPEGLSADLALLGIMRDLDIEPLSIRRSQWQPGPLELDVRVVGYGCTDLSNIAAGVGLRRSRQDTVTEVTRDQKLRHGDATCRGDSGGPLLAREAAGEQVVGVTSSGGSKDGVPFSLATSAPAFGAWVDVQADNMEEELAQAASTSSAQGCATGRSGGRFWPLWAAVLILRRGIRAKMCRAQG